MNRRTNYSKWNFSYSFYAYYGSELKGLWDFVWRRAKKLRTEIENTNINGISSRMQRLTQRIEPDTIIIIIEPMKEEKKLNKNR